MAIFQAWFEHFINISKIESFYQSFEEYTVIIAHGTNTKWRNRDVNEWHNVPQQICRRATV